MGKHLEQTLEPELWTRWMETYADGEIESAWDALESMCGLFRIAAGKVAAHHGYSYPRSDDERVSAHLKHVRRLPADAKEIY